MEEKPKDSEWVNIQKLLFFMRKLCTKAKKPFVEIKTHI